MICPECKMGGDFTVLAKDAPTEPTAHELRERAKERHMDCVGKGHCDCLHVVE